MPHVKRGLIVEYNPCLRSTLVRVLGRRLGCEIETASTLTEALAKAHLSLSWLLVDLCLGPWRLGTKRNTDGLTFLLEVRAENIHAPAIVFTAMSDLAGAINPIALGVKKVLAKPVDIDELVRLLCDASAPMPFEPAPPSPRSEPAPLHRTLPEIHDEGEEYELAHVARVLDLYGGRKRAAARHLEIDRRTIGRKIQRLQELNPARPPARPPAKVEPRMMG